MVPEAKLEQTEAGLVPAGAGWFVLNAREARWRHREGRGDSLPLTGSSAFEAESYFPQLGVSIHVLAPGEPIGMYHWESGAEAFLVLSGEPLLLVEGQERPLQPWDFFHCPPHTRHIILGAGEGPSTVLAIGSRAYIGTPEWGGYSVDELALRHGVGVAEETSDPAVAYARFPPAEPTPYREGWLPG